MNNNTIFLKWTDKKTGKKTCIGQLTKTECGYTFKYIDTFDDSQRPAWADILPFTDRKKVYVSSKMFVPFVNRLPDKRRVDIDNILNKYGLTAYDEFELLRRTKSKLPIDNYSFEETIDA